MPNQDWINTIKSAEGRTVNAVTIGVTTKLLYNSGNRQHWIQRITYATENNAADAHARTHTMTDGRRVTQYLLRPLNDSEGNYVCCKFTCSTLADFLCFYTLIRCIFSWVTESGRTTDITEMQPSTAETVQSIKCNSQFLDQKHSKWSVIPSIQLNGHTHGTTMWRQEAEYLRSLSSGKGD